MCCRIMNQVVLHVWDQNCIPHVFTRKKDVIGGNRGDPRPPTPRKY